MGIDQLNIGALPTGGYSGAPSGGQSLGSANYSAAGVEALEWGVLMLCAASEAETENENEWQ